MDNDICFLITLSDGDTLIECAVKIPENKFYADDIRQYPMEYKDAISHLLPLHVRSFGNIVAIKTIFDVRVFANDLP